MLKYKYQNREDIPEQYQDLYAEIGGDWVLSNVEGVQTQDNIDRLERSLQHERSAHATTKQALAPFRGLDAADVIPKLDRFAELEILANGKGEVTDEMIEARLTSRIAPIERERDELSQSYTDAMHKLGEYEAQNTRRTIRDALQSAANKHKVLPDAIDDFLAIGTNLFEVDESGRITAKDGVGVTPGIAPEVWVTDIKTSKPYFFPASQGGGARGSGGTGGGTNPFSKDGWNMTEQGRIVRENPERAAQLAKMAGTTIGGRRPQ